MQRSQRLGCDGNPGVAVVSVCLASAPITLKTVVASDDRVVGHLAHWDERASERLLSVMYVAGHARDSSDDRV